MYEPFRNADDVIEKAFGAQDPCSELLQLIRAHPRLSTITYIAVTYEDLAQKTPALVNKLSHILVDLKEKETGITMKGGRTPYEMITVDDAFHRELYESLGSDLVVDDASVSPSNMYLTSSLISATIVKLSLTGPRIAVNEVNRGLWQYEQSNDYDAAKHEVYVLGVCLQLAICGSYLLQYPYFDVPRVLGALEAIKSVGIVKHPQGQQLLDVCT